jgi:hypothetical protein
LFWHFVQSLTITHEIKIFIGLVSNMIWVFLAALTVLINMLYVQMRTQNFKASLAVLVSGLFFIYVIHALRQPNKCGKLAIAMVVLAFATNLIAIEGLC